MINLDVWLYGPVARYAQEQNRGSHAHLDLEVPDGTTMGDLLGRLGIPLEEKGVTFVNARLTDMPGLAADLELVLNDGDRIGLFHRQSMWPFQYRFGASVTPEFKKAILDREKGAIHHSPGSGQTE